MGLTSVPKDELADVRCIMLPETGVNCQRLDMPVIDADNENSCLMSYFQDRVEATDLRRNLINAVVMQFLDTPTFDELRTVQQLGYVVFCRPSSIRDVIGAWFLIQSPGKGCSHIANSLNEHLVNMGKKAQEISEEDF